MLNPFLIPKIHFFNSETPKFRNSEVKFRNGEKNKNTKTIRKKKQKIHATKMSFATLEMLQLRPYLSEIAKTPADCEVIAQHLLKINILCLNIVTKKLKELPMDEIKWNEPYTRTVLYELTVALKLKEPARTYFEAMKLSAACLCAIAEHQLELEKKPTKRILFPETETEKSEAGPSSAAKETPKKRKREDTKVPNVLDLTEEI